MATIKKLVKLAPSGDLCASCAIGGCAKELGNPPGAGFMRPDGEMTSGVMIVAEALGHHEAINERALVGESGFLMGRAFSRRKWKRDEFLYANVLWCQPKDNKIKNRVGDLYPWAQEAIDHCAPYLDRLIDQRQPRCIVAFGETAFERLTGVSVPLVQARGYAFRELRDRCWVVPTFHPAYMLRENLHLLLAFLADVGKARRIAAEGYRYDAVEMLVNPGIWQWERYLEDYEQALSLDPEITLACDIETPGKQAEEDEADISDLSPIDSLSVAFEGNRGATVPWRMPYLVGIARLLGSLGKKVFWNAGFDVPRLRTHYPIEGDIQDTMLKYHVCYNNQPKKLGYATSLLQHQARMWKHLGTQDTEYQVYDAVRLWQNDRTLEETLDQQGSRFAYNMICRDLDPVLERMTRAGMLVDPEARERLLGDLRGLEEELLGQVEQTVPVGVKAVAVKKTERGIVGVDPALLVEVAGVKKERTCGNCGEHPVTKTHVTRKTVEV